MHLEPRLPGVNMCSSRLIVCHAGVGFVGPQQERAEIGRPGRT